MLQTVDPNVQYHILFSIFFPLRAPYSCGRPHLFLFFSYPSGDMKIKPETCKEVFFTQFLTIFIVKVVFINGSYFMAIKFLCSFDDFMDE